MSKVHILPLEDWFPKKEIEALEGFIRVHVNNAEKNQTLSDNSEVKKKKLKLLIKVLKERYPS